MAEDRSPWGSSSRVGLKPTSTSGRAIGVVGSGFILDRLIARYGAKLHLRKAIRKRLPEVMNQHFWARARDIGERAFARQCQFVMFGDQLVADY